MADKERAQHEEVVADPTRVNGAAYVDDDEEDFSPADWDIDSIIPEEFKSLMSSGDEDNQDPEDAPPEQKSSPKEPEDNNEEAVPLPTLSHDEDDISDDDIDTSPEAIEKLLAGDVDAVIKKKDGSEEEDTPFWVDDEDYQVVRDKFETYGLDAKQLDKLVRKVADKYTVDNHKVLEGVNTDLENTKKELETHRSEIQRLRELERAVRFDQSDEVKEKYITPINQAYKEIQTVLDNEGATVSMRDVLGAPNRTELVKLLQAGNVEDSQMTPIINQWRNYKQLAREYSADKEKAQKSLQNVLSANISEDTANKVFKNRLAKLIEDDERFQYLLEKTKDGKLPEHVQRVATGAKQNYDALIQALNSPHEHAFSDKWLNDLAEFVTRATHNDYIQEQYYPLKKENESLRSTLTKLVKKHTQLAKAAKGIQGKQGVVRKNQNDKSEDDATVLKEQYQKILQDRHGIDAILPDLNDYE